MREVLLLPDETKPKTSGHNLNNLGEKNFTAH